MVALPVKSTPIASYKLPHARALSIPPVVVANIALIVTISTTVLIPPPVVPTPVLLGPPLLAPGHLVAVVDIVGVDTVVAGPCVGGGGPLVPVAEVGEGEPDGAEELARVQHAGEGADAQEAALVVQVLGLVAAAGLGAGVAVLVDDVRADVVGVVEEDGEGHHDQAVDHGGDPDHHVGLVHLGVGREGGRVEVVEDPEDDLGVCQYVSFFRTISLPTSPARWGESCRRYTVPTGEVEGGRKTYAHQEVDTDHQLESEQLGQRLVSSELCFENLVEFQARKDSRDKGYVVNKLDLSCTF